MRGGFPTSSTRMAGVSDYNYMLKGRREGQGQRERVEVPV